MTRPAPKGWCPGALTPMMSGDGLIVRVRPWSGRLTRAQVLGLCEAAIAHGSGVLDLTSRANLQIRGVREAALEPLQLALWELGLLDGDEGMERRRNILTAPLRAPGDGVETLAQALEDRLEDLPELPAKFGYAVDCGPARQLAGASADIRLERGAQGGLILRADGAGTGRAVDAADAVERVIELARWFAANRDDARRMKAASHRLPEIWLGTAPAAEAAPLQPGPNPAGLVLGAAFGSLDARALADLTGASKATGMRVTPWRLFLLEQAVEGTAHQFIDRADDPLLRADACPGAPFCPSASVQTRALAQHLARSQPLPVHVSGCPKGCARTRPAARTLVGRDGGFDLVIDGRSWEEPARRGLSPQALMTGTEQI